MASLHFLGALCGDGNEWNSGLWMNQKSHAAPSELYFFRIHEWVGSKLDASGQ